MKLQKAVLLLACLLTLVACNSQWGAAPLETPGIVDRADNGADPPARLVGWNYDADHMLLNRMGSWEWISAPAELTLYDRKTGQVTELNIPSLDYYTEASQGPDSRLIAYTNGGEVFVFNVDDGTSRSITEGNNPAIAPDGEQLAVWQGDKLIIVDLATLAAETIYEAPVQAGHRLSTYGMAWSPDGARLAYYAVDSTYRIDMIELASGQIITVAMTKNSEYPSWSPDSRMLTYVSGALQQSMLVVKDVINQCEVARLLLENTSDAYWSPAGDEIAIMYEHSQLYFVNVEAAFGVPYADLQCP